MKEVFNLILHPGLPHYSHPESFISISLRLICYLSLHAFTALSSLAIAASTRGGLAGNSNTLTPKASAIALTTAGAPGTDVGSPIQDFLQEYCRNRTPITN